MPREAGTASLIPPAPGLPSLTFRYRAPWAYPLLSCLFIVRLDAPCLPPKRMQRSLYNSTFSTLWTRMAGNQKENTAGGQCIQNIMKREGCWEKKHIKTEIFCTAEVIWNWKKTCYKNTLERKRHFSKYAVTHPHNMKCYQVMTSCVEWRLSFWLKHLIILHKFHEKKMKWLNGLLILEKTKLNWE